jgi:hypothetical protein
MDEEVVEDEEDFFSALCTEEGTAGSATPRLQEDIRESWRTDMTNRGALAARDWSQYIAIRGADPTPSDTIPGWESRM